MATFSALTDEVSRKLAGFTLRQDRQTHLTEDVTTTSNVLKIASATNLSTGVVQVDDELIYIDAYDRVNNTLSIPPYGRGYNGTKVQSHKAGVRIVISPTFPNVDIKQAINETILSVFPKLYVPGVYTFNYVATRSTYALPSEVEKVLSVTFETVGPTKQWMPVRAWRQDTMANTNAFNSRNSITVAGISPGRTVQVFYTSAPKPMNNDADDFSIVTGLPESTKDVIVIGASAKLASFVDPGRLTFGSAEADQQSQIAGRAYGAGTNAAKYLLALYDKRLAEEAAKLNDRNPIRAHYTN